jgi:hypothetical protein
VFIKPPSFYTESGIELELGAQVTALETKREAGPAGRWTYIHLRQATYCDGC